VLQITTYKSVRGFELCLTTYGHKNVSIFTCVVIAPEFQKYGFSDGVPLKSVRSFGKIRIMSDCGRTRSLQWRSHVSTGKYE
jgi:hypothetical protein